MRTIRERSARFSAQFVDSVEGGAVDESAERIVAVGLLTEREVGLLGHAFDRLWRVEEAPHFFELLQAIDEADRELWRARDADAANTLAQND